MSAEVSILHISDLHFGPPHVPEASEEIVRLAHERRPDAIAISGDLVQRSDFTSQWESARAFLGRLPPPLIAVPGNHDLPLYNMPLRWWDPKRRYRRFAAEDAEPVLEVPGAVLVGVDTTCRFRIIHGALLAAERERVRRRLHEVRGRDPSRLVVVVGHHPIVYVEGSPIRLLLWGARSFIRVLQDEGCDLYLSGHCHYPGVAPLPGTDGRPGPLVVQAGTASSVRGRGGARGVMAIHWIRAGDTRIEVRTDRFDRAAGRFVEAGCASHPRSVRPHEHKTQAQQ